MAKRFLHIGGLIAAGFSPDGSYLIAVSHNGRGVFDAVTWECVARDRSSASVFGSSPSFTHGIGPLRGSMIDVVEMNYETEEFELLSPDGKLVLKCASDGITIQDVDEAEDEDES